MKPDKPCGNREVKLIRIYNRNLFSVRLLFYQLSFVEISSATRVVHLFAAVRAISRELALRLRVSALLNEI